MEASYLEANTYGIGQLITQRKLLSVPEHQRDFAWEREEVEQFFSDVANALTRNDPDYFVGLIVLLGPERGTWQILDGQQRLATTTMIYSAVRNWLTTRGFDDDANQIESEFIGIRHLGGAYSPRLTMNLANRDLFTNLVVEKSADERVLVEHQGRSRHSSIYLMTDAILTSRELVRGFASTNAEEEGDQASRLFKLTSYLEQQVRVVALDVSSEANAFVIFESLNARGNELSNLDLVKNHVFGLAGPNDLPAIKEDWQQMASRIEDRNADDFLRVFWTSRYGRIQTAQLFQRIRSEFANQAAVRNLTGQLAEASEHYLALDDPNHDIWSSYGGLTSSYIEVLRLLGNRQVRMPVMSAIDSFDEDEMVGLLRALIILTVRYQVVGKRRTGALEIACARMANRIHEGAIKSGEEARSSLLSLIPSDEEFSNDFSRFEDKKTSRVLYLLTQLDLTARHLTDPSEAGPSDLGSVANAALVDFVLPKDPSNGWAKLLDKDPELHDEWLYRIANRVLVEKEILARSSGGIPFSKKVGDFYSNSNFLLTREIGKSKSRWARPRLEERQARLADLAPAAWPST